MTAREIATAVRSKQRSAREVVDEHLRRIDARESELHAFNLVLAEEARAAASTIDARVAAGEDVAVLRWDDVVLPAGDDQRGTADARQPLVKLRRRFHQ